MALTDVSVRVVTQLSGLTLYSVCVYSPSAVSVISTSCLTQQRKQNNVTMICPACQSTCPFTGLPAPLSVCSSVCRLTMSWNLCIWKQKKLVFRKVCVFIAIFGQLASVHCLWKFTLPVQRCPDKNI